MIFDERETIKVLRKWCSIEHHIPCRRCTAPLNGYTIFLFHFAEASPRARECDAIFSLCKNLSAAAKTFAPKRSHPIVSIGRTNEHSHVPHWRGRLLFHRHWNMARFSHLAIETFWRLIVLSLNQWPIWKLLKNRYIFDICLGRVMCMRVSCEWKQSKQTKTEQTNNCIANRKRALVSLNYSELEPARARAKVIVLFCEQTVARRTKRNSTVTTCGVICELRPSQNVSFHRECAYGSCE